VAERILIAVAWPYANGPFHLGHVAGCYLPADIFARFQRLRGREVLMVSGSDMHGTPVLVAAEKQGVTTEALASRIDALDRETFRALGISYDVYTSTHTPLHERTVHEVFLTLLRNGYIDRRTEEYPYCPKHARFLPDRYVTGECPHCGNPSARGDECDNCGRVLEAKELKRPSCSLCGTPAEFRPSEHFYLRIDRLSEPLEHFLSDKAYWRPNVLAFTQNFRAGGLHPTPITRDLEWGVPIPLDGYAGKCFYVWFEAVIGYLSASREWALRRGTPEAWHRFWDPSEPVRAYYFVGKDNIYHHTIFWPAMLLGAGGLTLPYDVPANEWLVLGGGKLSKSRSPEEDVSIPAMLERYPADVIRFYAALLAPQNHDTEFQWEEFRQVTETVLSNQWGNLVQRLLVFLRDREGGVIPQPPPEWSPERSPVGERLRATHAAVTRELDAVHLKEALELILAEVRETNKRFHDAKPWQADPGSRRIALYETAWVVQCAAAWLLPYLPTSSAGVFRMMGYEAPPRAWDEAPNPPPVGQRLREVRPLFPRPESPAGSGRPETRPRAETPPEGGDPAPLEIRVARIVNVEPHPSADRLYRLEVDVGPLGTRTIVAGLRAHFTPDQLRGARILLLANLEPRTIRSVTSHGMLLAADAGSRVVLLRPPEDARPGDAVTGIDAPSPTVSIDVLESTPLRVGEVMGPAENERSRVSLGDREVVVPGRWPEGERIVLRVRAKDGSVLDVLRFGPGRAATADRETPAGAKVR
jgi:methionyl-tRNA synthetase